MSAPRPYETDPFHPLGSISNMNNFYIYTIVYQLFLPCGTYKCLYMTIAHVRSQKTQIMIPSHFFPLRYMLVCIETCFTPKSLFVLSFKKGFKGKQKGRLNEHNTMNGIGFKSRA